MTALVKVFACLQAYANRPSTNPRGCVNDLWGCGLLVERDDGGVGSAITPRRMRGARLCARGSVGSELTARDVRAFSQCPGERRADDGRRKKGRCGASRAWAVPGHGGVPVALGAWGGARGCIQRSKVSMMRMRPRQQGQGGRHSIGSGASTGFGVGGAT